MRIVLMINDNPYNNNFVKQLCLNYTPCIKGIVISTKIIPGKRRSYFASILYVLKNCGFQLFILRAIEMSIYKAKHYLKCLGLYPDYFDVKYFCHINKIPIFKSDDINSLEFVEKFKKMHPEIVFSRINQIIKKDLLAIPTIGMINSHNSLLPKYKGVDTIFWGMVNKDDEFGITFHFINETLDGGNIIKQIKCSGFNGKSLHFRESVLNEISSFYLVELLKSFEKSEVTQCPMSTKDKSYYSLATKAGYKTFKKNGYRLITIPELGELVFDDGKGSKLNAVGFSKVQIIDGPKSH